MEHVDTVWMRQTGQDLRRCITARNTLMTDYDRKLAATAVANLLGWVLAHCSPEDCAAFLAVLPGILPQYVDIYRKTPNASAE